MDPAHPNGHGLLAALLSNRNDLGGKPSHILLSIYMVTNDPLFFHKFKSFCIGLFPERLKRGDRVMHDDAYVGAGALGRELTDSSGANSIIQSPAPNIRPEVIEVARKRSKAGIGSAPCGVGHRHLDHPRYYNTFSA